MPAIPKFFHVGKLVLHFMEVIAADIASLRTIVLGANGQTDEIGTCSTEKPGSRHRQMEMCRFRSSQLCAPRLLRRAGSPPRRTVQAMCGSSYYGSVP